jgi:tetratricopeptide (TPR) repeat protein
MSQGRNRTWALTALTCLAVSVALASPARAGGLGAAHPESSDMENLGPAPSGTDLTGQAPSSMPNKQDRSDVLSDVPPADPVVRAAILNQLYGRLRSARDAAAAQPITEAIEESWRHSGSDTIDLLMSRVDTFVLDANLDLAMQVLDAVTELAPDDAEAWHQRGIVHLMQKDTEQALSDLRRALGMDPHNYKTLRDLGAILRQTGDKKGALDAYRKALEVNPFLEQARRAVEELAHEIEGQDI